jgi:peptidoglycan hydrolase-like protein with peptidoglycan-binding domain
MLPGRVLSAVLLIATSLPCVAMTHPRRGPTSHTKSRSSKPAPKRTSGQRSIDDSRATEIQTALIHSGYLSGQASGHWDSQTEAAMQKFQSDNGWQTKLIPDSRAIIKLGLGPSHEPQAAPATSSSSMTTSALSVPAASFASR